MMGYESVHVVPGARAILKGCPAEARHVALRPQPALRITMSAPSKIPSALRFYALLAGFSLWARRDLIKSE